MTTSETEIDWRPSLLAYGIGGCAAVAAVAALVLLRPELLLFGAPLIGVVASMAWQRQRTSVRLHRDPDTHRLFESETAALRVRAEVVGDAATLRLSGATVPGVSVESERRDGTDTILDLVAGRWGRYAVPVRV